MFSNHNTLVSRLSAIRVRRFGAVAGVCVAVLSMSSAAAAAEPDAGEGSQVFAAWNDPAYYVPVPDGGFEDGAAGWSLSDGAAVVDGNETYQLGGPSDSRSLELRSGASATSPATALVPRSPVFRFVARGSGRVRVEVVYGDARSTITAREAAVLTVGDAWEPSRKLAVTQGLTDLRDGASSIRLRFTAVDGDVAIDDVYVDPALRR